MDSMESGSGARMRPTRHAWQRWIAGALLAIGLQCPAASHAAGCHIKVIELPVKMVRGRAIATVQINGTDAPMFVDSGAFFSFLTPAAAEQLHLETRALPRGLEIVGLAGKVEARATTVRRLGLVGGEFPDIQFVVGGNEDVPGTMGLIGRNILSIADMEYDLAHGMIRFVFPSDECDKSNMAYWAGEATVADLDLIRGFGERTPEIKARIQVNGKAVKAVFDTGAQTLMSLRAAHRVGVNDADMTPKGKDWGAGTDKVDSWIAHIDKVQIGGETITNNTLVVDDFEMPGDHDMLVGVDFFLSHRVYVSKQQSKMYFTYNGGPVFARNLGEHADTAAADAAASAAQAMTADALARRGEASLSRGDLAGALADLDRACMLEPTDAGHFWARARVRLAMEKPEDALLDLDTALQLNPALAEARILRAGLREHLHRHELALEDVATLDSTLAPQSDIRRGMAMFYDMTNMPGRALAQWNLWMPAHKHDIGRESALNSRCWNRVQLNVELDKALEDCDDAVDLDSKNKSYLDSRAWVYLRMGKLQKSLSDFDRALAIDPKHAWSLYGRGQVNLALGKTERGQADLAAARKERPGIDQDAKRDGLPLAPPPLVAPVAASAATAPL